MFFTHENITTSTAFVEHDHGISPTAAA